MKVSDILAAKGGTKGGDVIGIEPAASLEAAAKLLSKHRIGAVIIRGAGGRLAGILSERDIVRALAEGGAAALGQPVSRVMTKDVLYAQPGETVDSLLTRMTDRRIRHLPVCQNERLVGIVSIGDLVKSKISEVEAEADGLKAYIAAS